MPFLQAGGLMKMRSRTVVVATAAALGLFCVLLNTPIAQPQAQTQGQSQPLAQYNDSEKQYKTPADQEAERKQYADKIRESYNFRFGQGDISTPGNAAVEGNDFIQPGAFPKASYCKTCH